MWDINRSDEDQEIQAKCPQCSTLMANMGKDFAAPKKDNIKQWELLKSIYSVGINFHSCGCSGPGYIPNSKESLIAHFNEILNEYHGHLKYWQLKKEPGNNTEKEKQYWLEKIKEAEDKLNILNG
ncbi:hypothetical protein NAT51_13650 [Flavobacterium amniphilum]|uniref:hypothetical protein n=1 Tax=Flavobacterium amniphilum TaxID=1834035 RepID=UPI00202AADC1|nr:hypothetical protein [Flavobacterium amniphilum]MCL9806575.1 hypothetical protein [Flavobacterium amniphilum]